MSAPVKHTKHDYAILGLLTVIVMWPLAMVFTIGMGWLK